MKAMVKKWGARLLALALLLTLGTGGVLAQDEIPLELTVRQDSDNAVTVTVAATEEITLSNYDCILSGWSGSFTLDSVSNGISDRIGSFQKNTATGRVSAATGENTTVHSGETVLTYTLIPKETLAAGSYSFTLTFEAAADENGDSLAWEGSSIDGALTVGSAVTYTVTYDAGGGSGAPSAQTKTHGEALTLSSTKPTRSGYTFLGWAESSTATSAAYQPGGSFTKDADATLYAVWQRQETEITGSERVTSGGGEAYSVDVYCAVGETLTAYGARYSAEGQFLGFTSIALTPGQENELVIPVGDGSVIKVFVADGNSRPVCPSMTIPVD